MMPLAALEAAIVERIRAAKLTYLRYVGSYGGELVGDWRDAVRALPAVWVAFAGGTAPRLLNTAQTRHESVLTYSVLVADRSVHSEAATRQGGPASPGTYRMLADVAALLTGADLLPDVDYLRPGRVRTLFGPQVAQAALSVLSQEWTARCQFRLREPGQGPLGSEVGGYLPPDGQCLPGSGHVNDPAPLSPLGSLALRYWLKPPQDMATDEPITEDDLTLNQE